MAGTRRIAAAVEQQGGSSALQMQLVEEYIEMFGDVATTANISVVPLELAKLRGFFEGISEVTDGTKGD